MTAGAAIFALLAAAAGAEESRPGPVPEQGVLLLRNGQVIEGKIARAGDLYYVALPDGEIRIKTADVEHCCRNLDEGYRRKRRDIQPGNVQDHLRLARWCLHHRLLGPAGHELADALDADPTHPMIGVLRRRLKMALQPPKKSPQTTRPIDQGPSHKDLDRLVRDLPRGSVEAFTQTVQPLLMNNCTAAGCHGPQSESEYRLLRVPPGRPPTRRTTQRNLHATLQWIDREEPTASRLLTAPVRPHGTAKTAVFTAQQLAQYKRLVNWVCQVANRPRPEVPATITPPEKPPVQSTPAESPAAVISPNPKVQRGAKIKQFVPADPFDPEIFNRRFHPEK